MIMDPQAWIIASAPKRVLDSPSLKGQRPPNLLPIFDEELGPFAYQVAEDWEVKTEIGTTLIPAGFIMDGASVPRIFWTFYPPDGLFRAGVTFHDWGYAHQGRINYTTIGFSREEIDGALLSLCRAYNAPGSGLMHRMVRWFGGGPWKRSKGPRIEPLRYQIT